MKNILITSGGTREYIDEVRVLTNISSGKLGANIVETIIANYPDEDYRIHFVYVKGSAMPKEKTCPMSKLMTLSDGYLGDVIFYEVTDVQSVYDTLEKLVPRMDVVIHPMAISDFGFKPTNTKLKSNDKEAFIQSMKDRIYQTPKILSHIKKWNPNCFLISFKFENGLTKSELINIAYDSLTKNGSDIVIANDKAEMKRLDSHMSYFVEKDGTFRSVDGKENIAKEIFNLIK